jgi:DNA-binding transcriptional LysR family regulator
MFEIDGFEPIAIMVDRGLGVSLLHDWAPPWPEGLRLVKVPVPRNPFERRIGLLWMRAAVRSHIVRLLLEQTEIAFASPKRHSRPASRAQRER